MAIIFVDTACHVNKINKTGGCRKKLPDDIHITSPGHETPLASGVSTNVSVDVDSCQHDSEADVDVRQHDPEQDQDQPAFNRLWNNQYAALMELDI
eukprot:scaffold12318_cov151-Amphora_coffeaeformis.AAC.10